MNTFAMQRRKAFTLIELLVVIAIIAILAAILFPVFAQAKMAAKSTVTLSNMKQIGLGLQLYIDSNDDLLPKIRHDAGIRTWKHAIHIYVKNTEIFRDSVNPAAQFFDQHGVATFNGGNPPQPRFRRGYFYYRAFHKTGRWQDEGDYGMSQITEPANALVIGENKDFFPDYGPWIAFLWKENGWADTNWSGGKRSNRAMSLIFADSHAKFTNLLDTCPAPSGGENMWQYDPANLSFTINGTSQTLGWMETFCVTLRQKINRLP